jgi:hypothetical protein
MQKQIQHMIDILSAHARIAIVRMILILSLALVSTCVFAEDWKTTDGTIYRDVKVVQVEDDAVTILYQDGGALVPLVKLPTNLQQKFDYDPVKAKMAADARSKADAQNAKALQAEIDKANKLKRAQQIKDAAFETNTATSVH